MNKIVSMNALIPLMREQIENGGEVIFTPKGISMMPLLRDNKDTVTLKKAEMPLKKYQIALYERKNGKHVLHRVVGVKDNCYLMRGDNQFFDEAGIKNEQIIAVVSEFTRKGSKYKCDEKRYRLYCVLWVNTVIVRRLLRKIKRFAGRVKRRVLRIFR